MTSSKNSFLTIFLIVMNAGCPQYMLFSVPIYLYIPVIAYPSPHLIDVHINIPALLRTERSCLILKVAGEFSAPRWFLV